MNTIAQQILNTIGQSAAAIGQPVCPQSGNGTNTVTVVVELGPETLNRLDRIATAIEKIHYSLSPNVVSENGRSDVASIAPEYLSKEDAAQFLGVPIKTISYLLSSRKLRYIQIGSQRGRVIPVEELRKFAQQKMILTAEEMMAKKRRS